MQTAPLSRRADLLAQIANIEERIERLSGKVAAGNDGEPSTLAVRNGKLIPVGRNAHFLNINRRALADRKAKLSALDGAVA